MAIMDEEMVIVFQVPTPDLTLGPAPGPIPGPTQGPTQGLTLGPTPIFKFTCPDSYSC